MRPVTTIVCIYGVALLSWVALDYAFRRKDFERRGGN